MYTLEQLQQKTLKELKEIGWCLNVLPAADRRCRQNWIDALVGTNLPLLKLLEISSGVEVDRVSEAIEVQRQEPIKSKFGRIVYPKSAAEPIAPDAKISVSVEADHPQKSKSSIAHQLLDLFKSSVACPQEPIELAAKTPPGVETDYPLESIETPPAVALSSRFLSLYSLPQFENISYKADVDGQLSLLDFEVQLEAEPPDPDDFESLDDFRQAIALWDIEYPESLEVSLDSFIYQADYELAEPSEVMEFSSAIFAKGCVNESSSTYNFSIPTFDAWCDRTNGNEEPPTAGVGVRRSKPKPPSFPSMVVVQGDRSSIKKFARTAIVLSARASPGGDVVN